MGHGSKACSVHSWMGYDSMACPFTDETCSKACPFMDGTSQQGLFCFFMDGVWQHDLSIHGWDMTARPVNSRVGHDGQACSICGDASGPATLLCSTCCHMQCFHGAVQRGCPTVAICNVFMAPCCVGAQLLPYAMFSWRRAA